ncbi:MAG: TonB family protein [Burkholderiaceae bacterium]
MFPLDRWLILAAVLATHAAALGWLTRTPPRGPVASAEPSRLVAALITLEPIPPAPAAPAPIQHAPPTRPPPAQPAQAEPAAAATVAPPPALTASASHTLPTPAKREASPASDSPAAAGRATPTAAARSTTDGTTAAESAITPPSAHASHLHNRAPRYPPISRRLGEEGEVVLRLLVQADGSVGQARVERSSGHPRLDAAALEAARQWRFAPAHRGGQALDAWHTQALVFQLDA